MISTIFLIFIVLYLMVGIYYAFKSSFAFDIEAEASFIKQQNKTPAYKLFIYKTLLRLGLICAWPLFTLGKNNHKK